MKNIIIKYIIIASMLQFVCLALNLAGTALAIGKEGNHQNSAIIIKNDTFPAHVGTFSASTSASAANVFGTTPKNGLGRRWRRGNINEHQQQEGLQFPSRGSTSLRRNSLNAKSSHHLVAEIVPNSAPASAEYDDDQNVDKWVGFVQKIKEKCVPNSRQKQPSDSPVKKAQEHSVRLALEVVLAESPEQLTKLKELLKLALYYEQILELFKNAYANEKTQLQNAKTKLKEYIEMGNPQRMQLTLQRKLVTNLQKNVDHLMDINRKIKIGIDDLFKIAESDQPFYFGQHLYQMKERDHNLWVLRDLILGWEKFKPYQWDRNQLRIWVKNHSKNEETKAVHPLYTHAQLNEGNERLARSVVHLLFLDAAFDREARKMCLAVAFLVPLRNWAAISQTMEDDMIKRFLVFPLSKKFHGITLMFNAENGSEFVPARDDHQEQMEEPKSKVLKDMWHRFSTFFKADYSERDFARHKEELNAQKEKCVWGMLNAISRDDREKAKECVKGSLFILMFINQVFSEESLKKLELAKKRVNAIKAQLDAEVKAYNEAKKAKKEAEQRRRNRRSPSDGSKRGKMPQISEEHDTTAYQDASDNGVEDDSDSDDESVLDDSDEDQIVELAPPSPSVAQNLPDWLPQSSSYIYQDAPSVDAPSSSSSAKNKKGMFQRITSIIMPSSFSPRRASKSVPSSSTDERGNDDVLDADNNKAETSKTNATQTRKMTRQKVEETAKLKAKMLDDDVKKWKTPKMGKISVPSPSKQRTKGKTSMPSTSSAGTVRLEQIVEHPLEGVNSSDGSSTISDHRARRRHRQRHQPINTADRAYMGDQSGWAADQQAFDHLDQTAAESYDATGDSARIRQLREQFAEAQAEFNKQFNGFKQTLKVRKHYDRLRESKMSKSNPNRPIENFYGLYNDITSSERNDKSGSGEKTNIFNEILNKIVQEVQQVFDEKRRYEYTANMLNDYLEMETRREFASGPGQHFLRNMLQLGMQMTAAEKHECATRFRWFRHCDVHEDAAAMEANGSGAQPTRAAARAAAGMMERDNNMDYAHFFGDDGPLRYHSGEQFSAAGESEGSGNAGYHELCSPLKLTMEPYQDDDDDDGDDDGLTMNGENLSNGNSNTESTGTESGSPVAEASGDETEIKSEAELIQQKDVHTSQASIKILKKKSKEKTSKMVEELYEADDDYDGFSREAPINPKKVGGKKWKKPSIKTKA